MDCRPPGSSVHGIFWGRILEWVSMSFSRVSARPRDGTQISCAEGSLLHCRQILYQLSHERILLQCGRHGFYPWIGRDPGEGNSYPLWYSGLENSIECIVHGGHKELDMTVWLSLLLLCTAKKIINKKTVLRIGEYICKWSNWQGINLQKYKQLMQLNIKKNKIIQSKIVGKA